MTDAARPRRVVEISPNTDLHFYPPEKEGEDEPSVATLTLHNISERPALFKIKTTAPKRYCVRPNCGRIPANETTSVQVMLQPPFPPTLGSNEKPHKFLVQSVSVPEDVESEGVVPSTLWKTLETQLTKDGIVEQKLKCNWVFDMPPKAAVSQPAAAPAQPAAAPAATSAAAPAAKAPATPAASSSQPVKEVESSRAETAAEPAKSTSRSVAAPAPAAAVSAAKAPAASSSAVTSSSKEDTSSAQQTMRRRAVPQQPSSAAPAVSAGSTDTKTAAEQQPLLIIIVFILGVLFGKFVL